MSLYLILNILSFSLPLVLSFDKRVHFVQYWRFLIPSMIITMIIFIIWDVIFTSHGIWGFNERYHMDWLLFGLPLEEYLFFITVPFASIFTIYVINHYFPRTQLRDLPVRIISFLLLAFLVVMAAFNLNKAYTSVNFIFSALVIGLVYVTKRGLLGKFYIGYIVVLMPFMIVDGILTGSFIEESVVWYNDYENLGLRLGTVPLEDVFYGMSLILLNFYLTETFMHARGKRKNLISG